VIEFENLYCKMFVDFDNELKYMVELISKLTNGTIENNRGLISTEIAEFDVRENDDFKTPKELRSEAPVDTFLFWRYYIDIEPKEGIEPPAYVSMISQLLKDLQTKRIDAVAACDFENELPPR